MVVARSLPYPVSFHSRGGGCVAFAATLLRHGLAAHLGCRLSSLALRMGVGGRVVLLDSHRREILVQSSIVCLLCVAASGGQAGRRKSLILNGIPSGIRTRVAALKGQSPRPLDDGDRWE